MSSNHPALPGAMILAAYEEPEHLERVVKFIDRFTAMIVEKLEALDKKVSNSAPRPRLQQTSN